MPQVSLLGFFAQDDKMKGKMKPKAPKKAFTGKYKEKENGNTFVVKKQKSTVVQRFLHVGQKNTGCITCQACGMMYTAGIEEDEKLHKTFHRSFLREMICPKWKNERIVWETEEFFILIISSSDSTAKRKKANTILERINKEMKLVVSSEDFFSSPKHKVFICMDKKREVVACVAAEPLTTAYAIDVTENKETPITIIKEEREVQVGIRNMWARKKNQKLLFQSLEITLQHFSQREEKGKQIQTHGAIPKSDAAFAQLSKTEQTTIANHFNNDNIICIYS